MKVTSFSTQTSSMTSIDFGTLLTTIFLVVDDWYQKQVKKTILLKPGIYILKNFVDSSTINILTSHECPTFHL